MIKHTLWVLMLSTTMGFGADNSCPCEFTWPEPDEKHFTRHAENGAHKGLAKCEIEIHPNDFEDKDTTVWYRYQVCKGGKGMCDYEKDDWTQIRCSQYATDKATTKRYYITKSIGLTKQQAADCIALLRANPRTDCKGDPYIKL